MSWKDKCVLRFYAIGIALHLLLMASMNVFAEDSKSECIEPKFDSNSLILEKLSSLKKNQAMFLGRARVVGDFNSIAYRFELDRTGPLARDYSIKMVWAPDRRRALFAGANHGRPHRLNDVWEFDLEALSWILLYAPDNPRSYSGLGDDPRDVVFAEGVLKTKRGGPVVVGHSWWGTTYDTERRLFLFMSTWDTNQNAAIRQIGGDPSARYTGPPLWSFDPKCRSWNVVKSGKPYPRAPFGGLLEYIPDYDGLVWHTNHWQMQGTWIYRPNENVWNRVSSKADQADFDRSSPKTEQVGYYDPIRRIIVVQRGSDTFHFSIATQIWRHVLSRPDDVDHWPNGHDAFAPIFYDPVSQRGILVDFRTNHLWSYDPSATKWTLLSPDGETIPGGNRRLAYFDVEHEVLVVIDHVNVWAYRPPLPGF